MVEVDYTVEQPDYAEMELRTIALLYTNNMTTNNKDGWIAVDLDGTLAHYDHWSGLAHIGKPIPEMVERVKKWLEDGRNVKIFTARMGSHGEWMDTPEATRARLEYDELKHRITMDAVVKRYELQLEFTYDVVRTIEEWCLVHIGRKLEVTNVKDFGMIELWDDRAVQVAKNTGRRIGDV